MPELVLASTSRYRRELLLRLGVPFSTTSPEVDETPLAGERPEETALRLAIAKAKAVAARHPDALVIGSDQVATLDGEQIGKPGNHANAMRQLRRMSGRTVTFHTALCLYNSRTDRFQAKVVPFHVTFRELDDARIARYLEKEQPYDCAGSARAEGLGIALIARMSGDDPNALIGLPLIELVSMLANENFFVV
jgi:septum formation protein